MNNKTKVDRLHDIIPAHYNTSSNPNWEALLDAIGTQDEVLAQLVAQVREQFFVATASRPYLDTLGSNVNVSRPQFVGMQDSDFRKYIPILSYKPKQVKQIIDSLLDLFFFKESTTAYITSSVAEPYALQNNWTLQYKVDEINTETIVFNVSNFTNIAQATAEEVVATINRQAKYSYAAVYFDNITKDNYVRVYTQTIGSKGSLQIIGGAANIALQFSGFIADAGNGTNTQWTVTKVGDQVTFTNTGGADPNINELVVGDIIISNIPGNVGSFIINGINIANSSITFTNLFGVPGTYAQTSANDTKFLTPTKFVAYTNANRAMTWEVTPGEVIVEMPTSPPIVKRSLQGSAHINGAVSMMTNWNSATSLTLQDATLFPLSGNFWLQQQQEIDSLWLTPSENTVNAVTNNTRLQYGMTKYSYTSRNILSTVGDTTIGSSTIINLGSITGLSVGNTIFSDAFIYGTTILSIIGGTITTSTPATSTTAQGAINFGNNILTGITPNLPTLASLNQYSLSSLSSISNVVTGTTTTPHNFLVGDTVIISGSSGILGATTAGTVSAGSNLITNISNISGIAPGQLIADTSDYIPQGTTLLSIVGTTGTMSTQATGNATAETITFSSNLNGSFVIASMAGHNFTYNLIGANGTASTAGSSRVERIGLSNSGSLIYLTNSIPASSTRITGPYVWDTTAAFVLSSNTAQIQSNIQAGKIVQLLSLSENTIPAGGGYVIFDYGQNTQEGPVRYLYAPSNTAIVIDPSYIFQYSHAAGSSIVALDQKGAHVMTGTEYAPYLTDPSQARIVLENLIESVTSAGIFVDFLIRYPEQLYGVFDVYNEQGLGAGAPFAS